ncbi:hypothetical protein BGZ65_004761 [Modicella reniformis]|uniref:Uncharacterized protein n=1 Tax=Modicella reniformis TaxID=1440133 RepID=A0A9P6M8T4_9FUNG|nr:hypothetical protein BGZ65_004761 [Modicella reniformis]
MTPKTNELFSDYGKRAELEMQRAGMDDKAPAIISYLESTVPPAACSDMRQSYLIDYLYNHLGITKPTIPTDSFRAWLRATKYSTWKEK